MKMCGICGYIGDNKSELLKLMCDGMSHRGPDDFGTWHDAKAGVGLGHRRLSIIDLSPAGHQPMSNTQETIWLSFNGEIYNFQEYREQLLARGYRFRGHSDTEVLLYMYEEYGLEFLNRINGIFAVAIWDARYRRLLLARDHAGIKPLYYWQNGGAMYFASEIKALLRIPGVPRELNEKCVADYLTLLWIPGEETMLKAIKKIEPGAYMLWQDGRVEMKQWFTLEYRPDEVISEREWIERVHDTLMSATRRQMVSDVKLGAFLSGGIDSSSLVTFMRRSFPEREITCYTTKYDPRYLQLEGFEDDFPYARRVANILGITLKSLDLTPDIVNLLPKTIYHNDEPDADATAILTYLVSKMAYDDGVKVLLSGTGGDEIFFGYRSHQAYHHYERIKWVPRMLLNPMLVVGSWLGTLIQGSQGSFSRRIRKFRRGFMTDGLERHMALVDWSSPQARNMLLTAKCPIRGNENALMPSMKKYYNGFIGRGEINRHSHVLTQTFLASHNFLYNDKCSMATSVEIRVPFMDVELMRLSSTIPEYYKLKGNTTKYILKKAMSPYLPKDIIYRSKTGFAPPLREWIVSGLDEIIKDVLSVDNVRKRGLLDPFAVQRVIGENKTNKADHGYLIYALLTLEIWLQTFIDKPGIEISL